MKGLRLVRSKLRMSKMSSEVEKGLKLSRFETLSSEHEVKRESEVR